MVKQADRVRTPVDAFVLQKLEAQGLTLNPDADPRTLIRRLYFDLIGLPPTPEEIATFVKDTSPMAYETLVDRLLESPHYGERWARHWLDQAGYADSNGGTAQDVVRHGAWRYRDYVIRSLNADKPYDRFVMEQLAGDELVDWRHATKLTPEMVEVLAATGFVRCAPDGTKGEGREKLGERAKPLAYTTLFSAVDVSMNALLGLSVGCARCHNHKFDPIPQADYYKLVSFFQPALNPEGEWLFGNISNGRPEGWVLRYLPLGEKPIELRTRLSDEYIDHNEKLRAARRQTVELEKKLRELQAAQGDTPAQKRKGTNARRKAADETPASDVKTDSPEIVALKVEMARLEKIEQAERQTNVKAFDAYDKVFALWDVSSKPPVTHLLKSGNFDQPGEAVEPGVLSVLEDPQHPFTPPVLDAKLETTGRRRALAEWITRPDHPLTARVIVNKVWHHHFGKGIVPTLDDFGLKGELPTHPELIDWLAVNFVEGGWSLKKLHRLIVLSSVYRQSAAMNDAAAAADPANELLWRKTPLRLEAEVIRDAMLSAAGALDATMFGESVQVKKIGDGKYVEDADGKNGWRRGIYLLNRRTTPVSFLTLFDAPIMETNAARRFNSAVAPQSLAMMNSDLVVTLSQRTAQRVETEAGPSPTDQLPRAFQLTLGRSPDRDETAYFAGWLDSQAKSTDRPKALASLCQVLFGANEFIYID